MTPQTKIVEQEIEQEHRLDEQFVRQVEDHSRPAREVLTDQQQGRSTSEATNPPALFVP